MRISSPGYAKPRLKKAIQRRKSEEQVRSKANLNKKNHLRRS